MRLELSGRLRVHGIKMFLLLDGLCLLHMDLVPESRLLSAPFGDLWIRTSVPPTGAVSALVWLGWVYGLVQAGIIAHEALKGHLKPYGCAPSKITRGL